MSFALDANVLIHGAQEDSPRHQRAREFIEECSRGHEAMYLPWPVLLAFVRITTHPRLFRRPLPLAMAFANVEALLALPHVRAVGETDSFWRTLRQESLRAGARGPLLSDAHVAVLLRQHGVKVIYSNDVDLRKFAFLEVRDPFE